MKKVTAIIITSLALSACGTKTVIKEVAPTPTNSPVITQPASNKYDEFVTYVQNNSGAANLESRADIIDTGDLICKAGDSGKSISSITQILSDTAQTQSDVTLYATVMFGAITILCPEYHADLQTYLAN